MLLTIAIVLGFKKEITNKITGLTTHIAISNISFNSSNEPEPIVVNEASLSAIRKLPYVVHLQRTAFKNGLLKTDTENEGLLLKGVGKEYDFSFLRDHLIEGRLPEFKEDEASSDMLVSEVLVNRLGLKVDEKILVHFISQREIYDSLVKETITRSEQRSRKFTVCGIFKTSFADFDEKLSLVDLRHIQRLNYWDTNMVGTYEVKLKDLKYLEAGVEEISDLLGYDYTVSSVKELYYNVFIWLEKLDMNGVIIIVLMILVATINMITALLILILERTNMVGLVKALGMTNANVRKIFMLISLKLIGRGLLWGNIVGIGLCLVQYYFRIAKLNSETYYVDHVAIEINWLYFLLLNIGTFAVCGLMLILPTLILTRLTPVKTLKFD
jgi:lipoprotein-releasing system permease protein